MTIETTSIHELTEICAGLAELNARFSAVWKNGRWIITLD